MPQHLRGDVANRALRKERGVRRELRIAAHGFLDATPVTGFERFEQARGCGPRVLVRSAQRKRRARMARALLAHHEAHLVAHELEALDPLDCRHRGGVERAQLLERERLGLREVGERKGVQPVLAAARVRELERAFADARSGGGHDASLAAIAGPSSAARDRLSSGTAAERCGALHTGCGKWRSSRYRGITCQWTCGVMLPRLARFILWGCIASRTTASTAKTTSMRASRSLRSRSAISRACRPRITRTKPG